MSWLRFLGKTLTWLTWIGPKLSPVWRSQFWSNFRFLSRLSAWNEFWMVFDLTRAFWLDVDFQLGLGVDVSLGSVLGHFRSGMSSWVDFDLESVSGLTLTWNQFRTDFGLKFDFRVGFDLKLDSESLTHGIESWLDSDFRVDSRMSWT